MRIITALGLLALALGVRMLLDPWLGDSLSYPSMLTAVVLAAWYCGPGPAILIAIIGYPAIEYLFRDVPFGGGKLQYLVPSLGLYAGLVWVVVYFVNTLRHAHEQLRATQEDLRQSEKHNRAWFEQAAMGILEMDLEERLIRVNPEMCRMLGFRGEQLVGHSIHDIVDPEDQLPTFELMQKLHRGELDRGNLKSCYVRRNGSRVWVHATFSAIRGGEGEHRDYYLGIVEDVSDRKDAEKALEESKEQFEQLASHIPQGFWITDLGKRAVIFVSPAFERIHGVNPGSRGATRAWKSALHPDDRARVLEAHRNLASGPADVQYRILRPDGAIRWVHARGYPIQNADGIVYRVAGTIEDITERRALEDQLHHQAHFDSLTGLPNRVVFFDRLGQAMSHARRDSHHVALLFIDIDNFKIVNDTMGHAVGDKLLIQTGRRLQQSVRSEDTVARLGGDEFAIILPRVHEPEHASLIAQKALTALAQPLTIEGQQVSIAGSIGVAISSADGMDPQTLVKNADRAMFRAKDAGKNGYAFYTAAMNQRAAEQRELERLLARALEGKQFSLHFQAKASIRSGELTGCEALLRWSGPAQSGTGPAQFVPVLERSGLIIPVGEWVLRTACRQLADWKREGLTPLPIAINVSAKQFNQRNLVEVVEDALRDNEIDSSLLEIELTESTAMQNAEDTIKCLHRLKELGVKIAIDDFGTGHSSLSYLTRLPVDVLKIDRSFVTGLPDNRNDASIAKAIITMAHSLFLKVIAEGVEDERQLEFLSDNECDEVQGYLLSRPVAAPEMTRLMQAPTVMPQPRSIH
jgi:diguanylate cyclase (GGDEF)-like protein/PAS domain S-box-containing protein